jgi:hypothetical protein
VPICSRHGQRDLLNAPERRSQGLACRGDASPDYS